jgi:hypothetical protein
MGCVFQCFFPSSNENENIANFALPNSFNKKCNKKNEIMGGVFLGVFYEKNLWRVNLMETISDPFLLTQMQARKKRNG